MRKSGLSDSPFFSPSMTHALCIIKKLNSLNDNCRCFTTTITDGSKSPMLILPPQSIDQSR